MIWASALSLLHRSAKPTTPFTGIAQVALTRALNTYLEAAPKSESEKDQFRYVNLETWKIVQSGPCLQTGQIAARVREGAEKRGRHIDYIDYVLGKIVGRSGPSKPS